MHGRGVMTYPNGDKYDGEYKDNNKHGRGVFTWANANTTANGKMVYDTVYGYANGDKYEWKVTSTDRCFNLRKWKDYMEKVFILGLNILKNL